MAIHVFVRRRGLPCSNYRGSVDALEASGHFWSPDDTTKRVAGDVTWEPGARARLTLKTRLVDELANQVSITKTGLRISRSGDPARIVADYAPRVIVGDTAIGPVTCIDSYLQHSAGNMIDFARSPLRQIWEPYKLVIGAHLIDGFSTKIDAISFVLDNPGWWAHLAENDSASSAAGKIECTYSDDGEVWLTLRLSSVLSLRSADRAMWSVITLAKLALDVDLTPLRVRVREAGQTDWITVKSDSQDPSKTSWPNPHNLLPPESLTLERLARWLEIEQKMDGLAAAVADPVEDNAVQVHALTACSLVEGIHKRIIGGNPEYVRRATDLHRMALRVDREVTAPVTGWAKLVKKARNDLAHHNPIVSLDVQLYNWMIVESSVIWVLRLCLLSHAGFGAKEIRDALADHQRYRFYRENLKMHVKERSQLGSR